MTDHTSMSVVREHETHNSWDSWISTRHNESFPVGILYETRIYRERDHDSEKEKERKKERDMRVHDMCTSYLAL